MKKEDKKSYDVRGAAFKVYNELGPGLLECVYEAALRFELEDMGHEVQTQAEIPMMYRNLRLPVGFRLDLLVDNLVIVEIKSVEALADVHFKQVLTYLRLANKKLGILINFNTSNMKENIKRLVNNL